MLKPFFRDFVSFIVTPLHIIGFDTGVFLIRDAVIASASSPVGLAKILAEARKLKISGG